MSTSRTFLDLALRSSGYRSSLKNWCVLLLLLLLLAGCGQVSVSLAAGPTLPPASIARPGDWIISAKAISLLEEHGATQQFLEEMFDNPHTYLIIDYTHPNPFPHAIPVASFTSYTDIPQLKVIGIHTALTQPHLPGPVQYIAYDDEYWPFTPTSEATQPLSWVAKASTLVHNHSLHFISLPGMDLGLSATGKIQSLPQSYYRFVKDGYLRMAQYDDIFELQMENIEKNTGLYATLTQHASERVRKFNPTVRFFVQLTSNPNRQAVTGQDLLNAYQATRGLVDGYALTIPDDSSICPACPKKPNVQAMLAFLQAVEKGSSSGLNTVQTN
jgi:hypothetical protein